MVAGVLIPVVGVVAVVNRKRLSRKLVLPVVGSRNPPIGGIKVDFG
jgi:hypothetical protein